MKSCYFPDLSIFQDFWYFNSKWSSDFFASTLIKSLHLNVTLLVDFCTEINLTFLKSVKKGCWSSFHVYPRLWWCHLPACIPHLHPLNSLALSITHIYFRWGFWHTSLYLYKKWFSVKDSRDISWYLFIYKGLTGKLPSCSECPTSQMEFIMFHSHSSRFVYKSYLNSEYL